MWPFYDPLVTVHYSWHWNAIHVKLNLDGNQGASENDFFFSYEKTEQNGGNNDKCPLQRTFFKHLNTMLKYSWNNSDNVWMRC